MLTPSARFPALFQLLSFSDCQLFKKPFYVEADGDGDGDVCSPFSPFWPCS
jgi:hypothetical protein